MKKNSKRILRNYDDYDGSRDLEYYGAIKCKGRYKIDTKRYSKFFPLPSLKVNNRNTVFYYPSKTYSEDYICNIFRDWFINQKELYQNEFKNMISFIKNPEQAESDARISWMSDGILEYDEVEIVAKMEKYKRIYEYNALLKMVKSEFFMQLLSSLDALTLRVLSMHGYKSNNFSREKFDSFIQGKQGENAISFFDFDNYSVYEEAYLTWNFLKHNSMRGYNLLKEKYPKRICDPKNEYKNGNPALSVLNLDEEYIYYVLDNMHLFFDEVCARGFHENVEDASWDYDYYFVSTIESELESINNPLGIPPYL